MHRARSPSSNPPRTTGGTTILPLVVVALLVIGLFALWLNSSEEHPQLSTGGTGAPVQPKTGVEPSLLKPVGELSHARSGVPIEQELIELRVLTSTERRNGKPVPSIRVEVGRGSMFDHVHTALAEGATDERGEAVIRIARSTEAEDAKWWVRVVQDGYQRRIGAPIVDPYHREKTDPLRLVVEALPGATLTGRLVDENGALVGGRIVARERLSSGVARDCAYAEVNPVRGFELHTSCRAPATLHATSEERGTGVLVVDTSHSITDGSVIVVVRGRGVVRGRVNEATGAPAAGLNLQIWSEAGVSDWDEFLSTGAEELAREGRGEAWRRCVTDAGGAFEARGLREGRYFVFANVGEGDDHKLLSETPVLADATEHTFVLARPCIAVRIFGQDGEPWLEPVDGVLGGIESFSYDAGWPKHPKVAVCAAFRAGMSCESAEGFVSGRWTSEGTSVFDVSAGCAYTVALLGGEFALQTRDVRMQEGAGRVDVRFTIGARPAFGVLEVSPVTTNGQVASGSLSVRVEDSASGFPVLQEDHPHYGDTPIRYELPAGTYDVRVEGKTSRDWIHGTLIRPRTFGAGGATAHVRAGETSIVRPVVDAGGRLRVRLVGTADADDRAGVPEQRELRPEEIDEHAARVTLRLIAPNQWPARVDFISDPRHPFTESNEMWWLEMGSERDTAILPAGAFELEARTKGGRVVTVPVVLVDGQTTPVVVRFKESR